MADSRSQLVYHFVWSTKGRQPFIVAERERLLFRLIGAQAVKQGCLVLALNGTENHVHLLVPGSRTVAPATLMAQIKGGSSYMMNQTNQRDGRLFPYFDWRDGYGVFSLGWNQIPPIKGCIAQQKERHREGGDKVWARWEDASDS